MDNLINDDIIRFERLNPRFEGIFDDLIAILRKRSRILFVCDQAIAFSANAGFGVGKVIDILANARFGCAEFEVKIAARFGAQGKNNNAGLHEATYTGFRFDQTEAGGGLIIDGFDQVWMFGFNPGNGQPNNQDPAIDVNVTNDFWAMTESELEKLARWMDEKQGGVFATGDHHYLGASLCSRVPRIGIMRKWTVTDGVPTLDFPTRLDTNRPATPAQAAGAAIIPNTAERDDVPQRIDWVAESSIYLSPFFVQKMPHPILCHPTLGPIDVMPDHPHEGRCFDPADPAWIASKRDTSFSFNGYTNDQFPTVGGARPLPKIIAHGNTLADPPLQFAKGDQPARRFEMISVYDGQQIDVGRCVVDSTWHHWLNLNLDGLEAAANTVPFEKIKRYYINIGIWLASPAWRRSMGKCALYVSRFDYFGLQERTLRMPLLDLGRAHIDYLKPLFGPCWVRDWIFDWVDRDILAILRDKLFPKGPPCLSCPPIDVIEAAVMGGIVRSVFRDEEELNAKMAQADALRMEISEKEMDERIREGVKAGLAEFAEMYQGSLAEAGRELEQLRRVF